MQLLERLLLALGLAAALVLLRLLGNRHLRGLVSPPIRLPLVAIAVWLISSSVPVTLLPPALRPWWSIMAELVIGYGLIVLGEWTLLELPTSIGFWGKPPTIVRDLGLLAVGATLTVTVVQQQARINVVGLVTTSAVLTAVIGLAAQETLKDLFAGISLQLSVPFREGDWIEISGYRGQVMSLTLMNTLLSSMDGAHQVIPNSTVAQEVLRRYGPADPIGNRFHIGLDYCLPPAQARDLLLLVIRQHPTVLSTPEPKVWVGSFEESVIAYEMMVWQPFCGDFGRYQLRSELLEQIWYALHRAGHTVPYPVRELRPKRPPPPGQDVALASLEQRLRLLHSNQLFAALSEAQLNDLAALSLIRQFGPGETIVREGDAGDSLYQLVQGQVEVLKASPDGQARSMAVLGAGQIFGEMTLCLDAPRSATVRALGECLLLEVSRHALQPLLNADERLLEELALLMGARRAAQERLEKELTPLPDNQLFERMRQLFSSLLSD